VFSGLFLRQTSGDSAQITRPREKFTVAEPDRWLARGAAGAQIFTPQVDEATVSALVFLMLVLHWLLLFALLAACVFFANAH
jgi:hypothetical protein